MKFPIALLALAGLVEAQSRLFEERFGRDPQRIQATPEERAGLPSKTPATPPRAPARLKTDVELTILIPQFGASLEAQRWAKTLTDLGVTALMRQPALGDEPGIEEHVRGSLRTVRVIGALGRNGQLEVGEHVFSRENPKPLQEWLNELRTYGAQGTPQGKPLWGLTRLQFEEVYESLSVPVKEEVEDLQLRAALEKLPLPRGYPLRLSSGADARLSRATGGAVKNRVAGLTTGTALAIVLKEYGLAYRPLRTPSGGLELVVEPLSDVPDPWPLGWELPDRTDQSNVAPELFKFVEIGFDDAPLEDVLDAAAAAIQIPMVVDHLAVAESGVNLETLLVSYPQRRTSWSLMLNSVIRKAELIKEVRSDEAGRPFLYIAPFVPEPVEAK